MPFALPAQGPAPWALTNRLAPAGRPITNRRRAAGPAWSSKTLCPNCHKVARVTGGFSLSRGLGATASSPATVTLANSIINTEKANPAINNPGNLVYVGQAGATPGPGGLAQFDTYDDGLQALYNQIGLYANGTCGACGGQPLTIQQMANIYAPASVPGNNPTAYAQSMAASLGVTPDASLSSLLSGSPVSSPASTLPDLSTLVDTSGASDFFSNLTSSVSAGVSALDPVSLAALAVFGGLALITVMRAVEA